MGEFFDGLLLCVFDALRLADEIDLDLAGIFHLFLDLLGQVAGQDHHLILVDLLGLHHDTDLTAGLNGICLLNTLEGGGDALKLLQPLDVVLQILAPGAGTGRGNSVRRLHQTSHDGPGLHIVG